MREHERIICFLNELDFVLLLFLVAGTRSLVSSACRPRMALEWARNLGGWGGGNERSAVSTLNNVSKTRRDVSSLFVQMACPRVDAQSESASTQLPRVLTSHLVHAVQELQEDGREAAALAAGAQVAALAELVAEGKPLFLQQHLETLQSPVERVAEQLHQGHHLQTPRESDKEGEQSEAVSYKTWNV